MAETVANWLKETLHIGPGLVTFIVSMLPILELRGGLIVGALFKLPYWKALLLSVAGNIIPIPFILFALTPIFRWLKEHVGFLRPLIEKYEAKADEKKDKIAKAEFWGLMLFVGIPLPGTGAWTGGFIASVLGVNWKKAVCAILLGLVMAATIMSIITYVIPWAITLF